MRLAYRHPVFTRPPPQAASRREQPDSSSVRRVTTSGDSVDGNVRFWRKSRPACGAPAGLGTISLPPRRAATPRRRLQHCFRRRGNNGSDALLKPAMMSGRWRTARRAPGNFVHRDRRQTERCWQLTPGLATWPSSNAREVLCVANDELAAVAAVWAACAVTLPMINEEHGPRRLPRSPAAAASPATELLKNLVEQLCLDRSGVLGTSFPACRACPKSRQAPAPRSQQQLTIFGAA